MERQDVGGSHCIVGYVENHKSKQKVENSDPKIEHVNGCSKDVISEENGTIPKVKKSGTKKVHFEDDLMLPKYKTKSLRQDAYEGRIRLSRLSVDEMMNSLFNSKRINFMCREDSPVYSLNRSERRIKDKSDRATVENALDKTTRLVLYKLINHNTLYSISGCLSTGKEANVYDGITEDGTHYAIKVYRTRILNFKCRSAYVKGDFRFQNKYTGPNPLKKVRVWAEKEFRNLSRISKAGIKCPNPICLKSHVLLMSFIGNSSGWPAPTLKNYVPETPEELKQFYIKAIKIMWMMYHKCSLIHSDFSEYNLLVYKSELYVIDVSQSVQPEHRLSVEFLSRDCLNITEFFRKNWSMKVPDSHRLLHFIVTNESDMIKVAGCDDAFDVCIEKLIKLCDEEVKFSLDELRENEKVFCESYASCPAYKKDIADKLAGEGFFFCAGKPEIWLDTNHMSNPREEPTPSASMNVQKPESEPSSESEHSESDEESSLSSFEIREKKSKLKKDMDPEQKKLHKKAVKEEMSKKRQNKKVKKHVKKRAEKVSRARKQKKT